METKITRENWEVLKNFLRGSASCNLALTDKVMF